MDHTPKSTTHQHFHYHYHYDLPNTHLLETHNKHSSPSLIHSQNSHSTPYKATWKNHINPEVTKIYDEMSVHESFDDEFSPKASRLTQMHTKNYSNTPNHIERKRPLRTRAQILQDIQVYKDYLKKHSRPNLFIPNESNLHNLKQSDSQPSLTKKFTSLNDLMDRKEAHKKTLEELVLARTQSKIISKQDLSTMHETQNPNPSELYFSKKKMLESQKNARQSEIKSPTSTSAVFERARIRMSHIQDPTHQRKTDELENSNFSLFQREAKKQESGENSEVFEHRFRNESELMGKDWGQEEKQKNVDGFRYAYELMREECNFLRNKYMQHAQSEHGAKF